MATIVRRSHLFIATASHARLAPCSSRLKTTVAAARPEDDVDVKPFSQIPGPKGLPVVGNFFEAIKATEEIHLWTTKRHAEFGPIFRSKAGVLDMVFLRDADAVEQLVRQDGKYPQRIPIPLWADYREKHGIPQGLATAEGEFWHRLRRVIDKPLLKVRTVNSYAPELNEVNADFLDRLSRVRRSDNSIHQLDEELYSWSVESVARLIYETRLGCLSDNRDPDTQQFIDSSHTILEATRKLIFMPGWFARIFRRNIWKQHEEAWDTAFRIAFKIIDSKVTEIQKKADEDEEVGLLASFLQEKTLTMNNVYSNVSELMGAAIDTTSNTTQMLIYELSRNPEIQNLLVEEVNRIIPPREQPTADHLKDMHYLKGAVKETLRMYPIASSVSRILPQEAVVLGYRLPKGTTVVINLYTMGRHPKYYDHPDAFKPERWLREDGKSKIHPFAWLPFGFGPRMCVGRRVAELEIQLLISQLVRKFNIEPVSDEPVELKTDMLLIPKTAVKIRLNDRN